MRQGRSLARWAPDNHKLLPPGHFAASPLTPFHGIVLRTVDVRFGGPSAANLSGMWDRPENSIEVNRASLVFTMRSRVWIDGFSFLQTGDAFHTAAWPDVRGSLPRSPVAVQLLQVPHHGSARNSDENFFAAFPAQHYLISAKYSHFRFPRPETMLALVTANRRAGRIGYAIWCSSDAPAAVFSPLLQADEYQVFTMRPDERGWERINQLVRRPLAFTKYH